MKKLSGGVKLALAQYRELAAFAQFASDLDAATRKQLERGQRITELMKQRQYAPMSVAEMSVSLLAVNEGFIDDVAVPKVRDFEDALQAYMKQKHRALLDKITAQPEFTDAVAAEMREAIKAFKTQFAG
jgi:F-type H+-transporting ATPase subunit alpha